MRIIRLLLMVLAAAGAVNAQVTESGPYGYPADPADEQCGHSTIADMRALQLLGAGWGYTYDSLLKDITVWRTSPYVAAVDSIGASVQKRALWQLTITSPTKPITRKRTVYIHARTHPNEVQAQWVANQMIEYLTSDDPYAGLLRQRIVFYIIPMYNPDGVELEKPRENANNYDLEREWNKVTMQPEPTALRNRFLQLMNSPSPIEVALNLHSSYACKRYFVFHDPAYTSARYADMERRFITACRSHFDGIEPWDYNVTWKDSLPPLFPESYHWINYREAILALTYEDGNCATAGKFDTTARAIMQGIGDYMNVTAPLGVEVVNRRSAGNTTLDVSPTIISGFGTIRYALPRAGHVTLGITNTLGTEVLRLVDEDQHAGTFQVRLPAAGLRPGFYFCRLQAGDQLRVVRVVVAR